MPVYIDDALYGRQGHVDGTSACSYAAACVMVLELSLTVHALGLRDASKSRASFQHYQIST